jgi:transposase
MKQRIVYVGLDIAKAYLDLVFEKESRRFANSAAGRNQLLQWLGKKVAPVQVICEASGGYERGVLRALQHAGVMVSLVQASRVRQFARAAGVLAKTDAIDASVLAAFGAALQPPPTLAPEPEQEKLRELESQRRHLSLLLVGEQNRAQQLSQARLCALSKSLIAKIKKQITQIDALIKTLLDQSEALGTKAQKLTALVGVGPRTAALLLAQMPELGKLNRREAAALAGLAPFNRDSGTLHGKRAIFGGRRAVRSGLYMAALVAARHNPILANFYQRLRSAGKPPKLALTATMRKLLIVLNSALKTDPLLA